MRSPTYATARCVGLLAIVGILSSGCETPGPFSDVVAGPGYTPKNSWTSTPRIESTLRRLAILPTSSPVETMTFESGRILLNGVLRSELARTRSFELVVVSPAQLKRWTGREDWLSTEALPPNFAQEVLERSGCDAILLNELTDYRPYPPLAVGWRLKLVEGTNAIVRWSVDELFDSGQPRVANSARRFYQTNLVAAGALADSRGVLESPERFARYATAAALSTLPPRASR